MTEQRDLEFVRAFWDRTPVFTYVFLAANILVYLLMLFAGGATQTEVLRAFGAKENTLIQQGEFWRFVTPVFIHIGLIHLLLNSYGLWMVGTQVEKLYGGARFVVLYLACGAGGVAASYWRSPILSAGASGAIFGLFGVLLVFGFKHRDSIPAVFRSATGAGVLPIILGNLIIGYGFQGIDNAAHIGGLVTGAALAAIVDFERPETPTAGGFRILQTVLLLAVAMSFYQVYAHYDGPRISARNFGRSIGQIGGSAPSPTDEFFAALNSAQKAYDRSMMALSGGNREELAAAKENTVKAMDRLKAAPSIARRADAIAATFLKIMEEQYALLQDAERAGTRTFSSDLRARENAERHEKLLLDFRQWQADGEK